MNPHDFITDLKRGIVANGVDHARILMTKDTWHWNLWMSSQVRLEVGAAGSGGKDA